MAAPPHGGAADSRKDTAMADKTILTETERRNLADLFDALIGVASENGTDFFDSYHKRSGATMLTELETFLQKHAPAELAALAV